MVRPLQLWLPLLHLTASTPAMQRDQQRAFEEWRGEHTVWLVPGLQEVRRWTEGLGPYDRRVAVPAAELEGINVYHVDRHARVDGYHSMRRFPGGKVTGMFQDWLNSACDLVWAPRLPELRLRIPTFADGIETYTEQPICLTPD